MSELSAVGAATVVRISLNHRIHSFIELLTRISIAYLTLLGNSKSRNVHWPTGGVVVALWRCGVATLRRCDVGLGVWDAWGVWCGRSEEAWNVCGMRVWVSGGKPFPSHGVSTLAIVMAFVCPEKMGVVSTLHSAQWVGLSSGDPCAGVRALSGWVE